MKITIKHYDNTYTIEQDHDEQNTCDMIEVFEGLLLSMGFPPESVKDSICERAAEIEREDKADE